MFLDRILPVKREEVDYRSSHQPVQELKAMSRDALPVRDFSGAVKRNGRGVVSLIAEIKKSRSDSPGFRSGRHRGGL